MPPSVFFSTTFFLEDFHSIFFPAAFSRRAANFLLLPKNGRTYKFSFMIFGREGKGGANVSGGREKNSPGAARRVRREFGWYEVPDQLWKAVRKLLYVAVALFLFWFLRECYLSWDIFS